MGKLRKTVQEIEGDVQKATSKEREEGMILAPKTTDNQEAERPEVHIHKIDCSQSYSETWLKKLMGTELTRAKRRLE